MLWCRQSLGGDAVRPLSRTSTALHNLVHRQPDALRRPPLDPPYRLLKVWPVRRSPVRYSEDPRQLGDGSQPTDPGSLPMWRSLRTAKRKAVGTVIYARQGYRDPEPGARREWLDVRPVAYRASLDSHWITDWWQLEENRRVRTRTLEWAWTDFLGEEDRRFLEVMQFVHGHHRAGESMRFLAESLLEGNTQGLTYLIDEAWVRRCSTEDFHESYEVSIGSGIHGVLVGETDDMGKAMQMAKMGIDRARDLLAARLAEAGGLSAEVASSRDRWPEPRIHYVPDARDRAADFDRLRRHYEELRDQIQRDEPGEDG